jgi:biotin carboxyl carrier protein
MKMENEYRAIKAGRVAKIHAPEGANLEIYAQIITLEPHGAPPQKGE